MWLELVLIAITLGILCLGILAFIGLKVKKQEIKQIDELNEYNKTQIENFKRIQKNKKFDRKKYSKTPKIKK